MPALPPMREWHELRKHCLYPHREPRVQSVQHIMRSGELSVGAVHHDCEPRVFRMPDRVSQGQVQDPERDVFGKHDL